MIDFELAKSVDLVGLAGRYVELNLVKGEHHGPCPICGTGTDRFVIFPDGRRWYCRKCSGGGSAIDLLMKIHGCTSVEAAAMILGTPIVSEKPIIQVRASIAAGSSNTCETWQGKALAAIAEGMRNLEVSDCLGSSYLASRGFDFETAKAFRFGFDPENFDPATKMKRPAIVIPWIEKERRLISALKYRFVDDLANNKTKRFTQKRGSKPVLFGTPRCTGGGPSHTLIGIEGEFNCLSVWQVTRKQEYDVVSVGSDSSMKSIDALATFAREGSYRRLLVWMDEENRAIEARRRLNTLPVIGMKSPCGKDANELLLEGQLLDLVEYMLG